MKTNSKVSKKSDSKPDQKLYKNQADIRTSKRKPTKNPTLPVNEKPPKITIYNGMITGSRKKRDHIPS